MNAPADYLVQAQRVLLNLKGNMLIPPIEGFARDRKGSYVANGYEITFENRQIHLKVLTNNDNRYLFNLPLRVEYLSLVLWFVLSPYWQLFQEGYQFKRKKFYIRCTDTIELWVNDRLMGWYEDGGNDLWGVVSAVVSELK